MHCTLEPLESRRLFAATRIMPLGDSITEGLDGEATYRYWLWHALKDRNFDVDFVGTQQGVFNGTPRFPDFDQDHQGLVGWRAEQIASEIGGWATTTRPDVVLLHTGTNDILQGQSTSSTIDDIRRIIDNLRAVSPDVTILLAKIIPLSFYDPQVADLNDRIPGLVNAKDTPRSRVLLVDQFSGFDAATNLWDGIHPNESGEKKLSSRWFDALAPRLNVTPPPPPPTNPIEYIGDFSFRQVTNGLGPVERNKSNGGAATGDGRSLKLNGTIYRKGLGTHAQSDIRVALNGEFKTFLTYAGVDDEVGNHAGSVIFRVYLDNAKVYDSGPVYGRTGTKAIVVNVTGAQSLRLLVTDKGDGNANDHADWAEARLVRTPFSTPSGRFSSSPIWIGSTGDDDGDDDDSTGFI